MKILPDQPVFPISEDIVDDFCGLTAEQYAAIRIMAGLPYTLRHDEAARIAVQRTKSLFAQLNREEK